MSIARTLPARLAPIDGEALDSWLEALAYRMHTAFGDLLCAVGLSPVAGIGTTAWMVHPSPDEIQSITAATGIDEAVLKTMTLHHYSGRALHIDPDTRTVNRGFPWGCTPGSRFCPACLAESGGRWQLAWRLGWTFACTRHGCLLADSCPRCGAVQRHRARVGDLVPQPGRCAHPAQDAMGRTPERCDADLTASLVTSVNADHPVLRAQQIIDTVIDTETTAFGVYNAAPAPRLNILADIRAIAGRALAYAAPQDLERLIPPDVLTAHQQTKRYEARRFRPAHTDAKPGLAAPAYAATTAVGVLAALQVLDNPDISTAGDALRWLVTSSRAAGSAVSATNIGWGRNTTSILTAVQLSALGPLLKPNDQLRYRTATPMPRRPEPAGTRLQHLARRLPTSLWPVWSLPLAIPDCHQRMLRPALSAAMLLIGTRATLSEAAELMGSPITGHAVSRILQLLQKRDEWADIRAALTAMADFLTDADVPIDYQRRRRLNYSSLLPDEHWIQMCRDTGSRKNTSTSARIARCHLYEQLSGNDATTAPFALDDNEFRTKTADFPEHLTPELAAALHAHAGEFLTSAGIADEPVCWEPPAELLRHQLLPGADPASVDCAELHRLIRDENRTLGHAATHLGTTLDAVRYCLNRYPAPAQTRRRRDGRAPDGVAYRTARSALSCEEFLDLYAQQRMTLRDIAARVGVSRQVLARLACHYDIALDEPGRRLKTVIDRDWLYTQYITHHRTLPDIAQECGITPANLGLRAKALGIPIRGRGGPSHRANLAAADIAASAPAVIRPALAEIGGRDRLERFADASRYRTLTIAAKRLGVHQFTLVNQLNRIERELGTKLLIRAERGRPMKLTDDGNRVVAAIRAWQGKGW